MKLHFFILVKQKNEKEWVQFENSVVKKSDTSDNIDSTNNNTTCQKILWERILNSSLSLPSPLRDRNILVPYLQRQGFKNAPEEWLSYVSRLEQGSAVSLEKLKEYYSDLAENSGNLTVQESAKAWLKKHFPKRSDTIIW